MGGSRLPGLVACLLSVLGILLWGVGAAGAGELSPEALRGKEIYLTGTTSDGAEVTALMGDDQIEVPATALPCANCHGADGRGRPEGGVSPTDLTWGSLTRPYEVEEPSGRRHGPYDERALKRAISLGFDPAGNPLHIAMPRYRMEHGDLEALVAYLRTITADRDPGVGDRELTLGLLLPPASGPLAPVSRTVATVARRWAERVNERGGVYGRELRLVELQLPAEVAERRAAAERFLDERPVFALLTPFFAGADAELAALADERGVPSVAPFTLDASESFPVNREVFYLWSGIAGQARALAVHAGGGGAPPPSAIAEPSDGALAGAADAVVEEIARLGGAPPERVPLGAPADPARTVEALSAAGVADLYLLDPGPAAGRLLEAAAAAGWRPRVLVPGSLAGAGLFETAAGLGTRLVIAYPTVPGDRDQTAAAELTELTAGLPESEQSTAVAVLAGGRLLAEALERSGRAVSRERVIAALENLYQHSTALSPPVTYGPNRRVGARGAYVVAYDPATGEALPAGGWVPVEK